jgi:hypothetical protein
MPDDAAEDQPGRGGHPELSITAAIVDTNFGTAGNFDATRLRGIADRLRKYGIDLWVPRQVVWEWAVHAHESWEKIRREHKRLVLGGFASDQPSSSAVDLVDALEARVVEVGAHILPTSGASAVQAIRDQVLGTGPGKTEKGVRTGAVDSAWVRDAVQRAELRTRQVVFLTNNESDVLRTTRAMDLLDADVRIAHTEPELFEQHVATMVAASIEVTRRVAEALLRQAAEARRDQSMDFHDAHPPWFESSDLDVNVEIQERREWIELESREGIEIGLPQPIVVGLSNVRMDAAARKVERSITFDLTVLGGVVLNGYGFDESGGVGFSENYLNDVLITVPCVMDESPDGGLSAIRQTDTGTVRTALAQFDDDAEALAWTMDELSVFEHVTLSEVAADEDTEAPEGSYTIHGPNDQAEIAELHQDPDGTWQLEFVKSGATISCTYDPDAYVRFDGETYEMYPPYTVHAPDTREPYSAIAKVWRYLLAVSED